MSKILKNYKGELFTDLDDVQSRMKKVADRLLANFEPGKRYIPGKGHNENAGHIYVGDLLDDKNKTSNIFHDFFAKMGYQPNNFDNTPAEYRGLYVFADIKDGKPEFQYVGISQKAIQRIKMHFYKGDKYTATWAYLMAKEINGELKRKIDANKRLLKSERKVLDDEISTEILDIQTKYIFKLYVSFFQVDDDNFFLHMAEPYVACALNSKWNSFKT